MHNLPAFNKFRPFDALHARCQKQGSSRPIFNAAPKLGRRIRYLWSIQWVRPGYGPNVSLGRLKATPLEAVNVIFLGTQHSL